MTDYIGVQVRQTSAGDGRAFFKDRASERYAMLAEEALAEVGSDSPRPDQAYWLDRAQVLATLAVAARPVR